MRVLCLPQPSAPHERLSEVVDAVASSMAAHERRTAALIEAARRRGQTRQLQSRDAAAFLWACFTVAMRHARLDPLHAAALVSTGSLAIYLPVYLAVRGTGLARAPKR